MNKIIGMRGLQLLAGGALMMVASLSQAQWVWVDAKGVKQFSDRSPPSNIPQKNILKAPRGMMAGDSVPAAEAAQTAPAAAASAAPPNLADRETDYRKRQQERVAAEKKATEEAAVAQQKKSACDSARNAKAQLDSGVRVRSGPNGEFMDDQQRAQENANVNKALNDCR